MENQCRKLSKSLQIIDNWYKQQNEAVHVLPLLAEGNIKGVIDMIESIGENNEEILRRKFMLYMLCLLDLALLEGKEKPFRRSAMQTLLQSIDRNLPLEPLPLLSRHYVFPGYPTFLIAVECADLGLDHLVLFKKTKCSDTDWIAEVGPLPEHRLELLVRAAIETGQNGRPLAQIALETARKGYLELAIRAVEKTLPLSLRCDTLATVASMARPTGAVDLADHAMARALKVARGFSTDEYSAKCSALAAIGREYALQGDLENAVSTIEEAIEESLRIDSDNLLGPHNRICGLKRSKSNKNRDLLRAGEALQAAVLAVRGSISEEFEKKAVALATEAQNIPADYYVFTGFFPTIDEHGHISRMKWILEEADSRFKKGAWKEAALHLQNWLDRERGITNNLLRQRSMAGMPAFLAACGRLDEAIALGWLMARQWRDGSEMAALAIELAKKGLAAEALSIARGIYGKRVQKNALLELARELARKGFANDSLAVCRQIIDGSTRCKAMAAIAVALWKSGPANEAESLCREVAATLNGIRQPAQKCAALTAVSNEWFLGGRLDDARSVLDEALAVAERMTEGVEKRRALLAVAAERAVQGYLDEALLLVEQVTDEGAKNKGLAALCGIWAEQGLVDRALETARRISATNYLKAALCSICAEWARHGLWERAENYVRELSDPGCRFQCRRAIAQVVHTRIGAVQALRLFHTLPDEEARSAYIKGCVREICPEEADRDCFEALAPLLENDPELLECLLQMHALHLLFLDRISFQEIRPLDRTLNIRWAIDLSRRCRQQSNGPRRLAIPRKIRFAEQRWKN